MPVYKDNRNNSYYFKVCINGRQFLRRGFISKKEARNEEVKFLASNGATKKTTALLYCELLDSYKTYLKDDLKFTTYKDYCRSIDNYYKFLFPNIDIRKLTPSDVVKVRKKIDKENISSSSKNTRRTFLFRFFKYVKLFYDYDFYYIERMKKFRDDTIKKSLLNSGAMKLVHHNGKEIWKPKAIYRMKDCDDLEILDYYNSKIRGFYNYYCIANNSSIINNYYYIMQYSMLYNILCNIVSKIKGGIINA